MNASAQKIMRRIEVLGKISDEPANLTRTFASPAMWRVNELVGKWMRLAGMVTRVDAIGNLIGHYAAAKPDAKKLLFGSHLDTVRNAGKFDGPLGVILAIACVEHLHRRRIRLPFGIEVIGFADEEGVRYQTAYLGSRALSGELREKDLNLEDEEGISLRAAIKKFGGDAAKLKSARRDREKLLGYIEAHIEQGPVLASQNLAVGVVTVIAGQTRARLRFVGRAGHAGTTPMNRRQDALPAAAEFILAAENLARNTLGAVATVGEISARPGASNVIPGEVLLTLDVRHEKDAVRKSLHAALLKAAGQIARRRKLRLLSSIVSETPAVHCCRKLSSLFKQSLHRRQKKILALPSGAGHDAAVMARLAPMAMLFIRCKNGVSHHPAESVTGRDTEVAFAVLNDFLASLAEQCGRPDAKQSPNRRAIC